uniref:SLC26A/SulP transporter domain-containing protein n=1 Tax=Graphocephala atropunctata TaxID=36148 RepID=A0A1B6LV40_9HEMI
MDDAVRLQCSNTPEDTFQRADKEANQILYKVDDQLPCVFSFLNALQILLSHVLQILWLPLLLSPALCLLPADPAKVVLVSTAFLTSGVVTTLQSFLGVRLPTVTTPSPLYMASFVSLLHTTHQCPSDGDLYAMGPTLRSLEWQTRLRELQGALLFAGVLQTIIGLSGLQARLCRVLSPVAVAPAVVLAGLTMVQDSLTQLAEHCALTAGIAVSVILFALCLRFVRLPLPTFSIDRGLTSKQFPVFQMFPVLWTCVAVFLTYEVVAMFHTTTFYPDTQVISFVEANDNSNWFSFALPFEWGLPTLSVATAVHVLPAVLLQSLLSLFMFYASANTCGARPPPQAAVRRGLAVEGLGLMFGSVWGHGVTTSPANIGLMSLTGVASRSSTQLAALMMIFLSHFTRLTSIIAKVPVSFLYALHLCLLAGLVSVGISILKFINFSSRRDVTIVGFSLFLGLIVPQWVSKPDTGLLVLDNFISQFLTSSVFVGALSGCLLDLLIPGRVSNKKTHPWKFQTEEDKKIFRLPTWEEFICSALERSPFFSTD